MTYIEFFDKTASENVSACLTYAPERVIFVGDNAKHMQRSIGRYAKVFENRGIKIEFLFKTVSKSNLDGAIRILSEIVETYDDCVFDITGGEEILNLALGVVYARYPEKNIQIHRFNLRNNMVYDCDSDGQTIYRETPTLSVQENVQIYGGDITGNKTCTWDMTPDFCRDIDLMWAFCKKNVRYWNMQIGIFAAVEETGYTGPDGLVTTASRSALNHYLQQRKVKYKKAPGIINYLLKQGLLTLFEDEDETIVTVGYKNEQVKKCLTKAGQALEMKVFAVARQIRDEDGAPVYDDAMNGVVIDWDGQFHDEQREHVYDTENEVDVVLMHDMVPVFISCKNGIVTSDELYKLNTVAERFGGPYSKKVLIATALSLIGEAGDYLRQRAQDMRITLIENVQELDDETLEKKLKNLWRN